MKSSKKKNKSDSLNKNKRKKISKFGNFNRSMRQN